MDLVMKNIKKSQIAIIAILGAIGGWLLFGGTTAILHYTSSTEFCVSCHTMQIPKEEWQGSRHFSNPQGIRAECSDCHIPPQPIDYLLTKIRATKDIYHEFITGKIDTEEKYEEHRLSMAQMVWDQMKANDSATCRTCHTYDAMEMFDQTRQAMRMHQYGIDNNQTCIDCHKGVAHILPQAQLDTSAFDALLSKAKSTPVDAKILYPLTEIKTAEAVINPTATLNVIKANANERTVQLDGYQMKGAEQLIYMGQGKRAIFATLSEQGKKAIKVGQYSKDEYGNEWRSVSLTTAIANSAAVVDNLKPVWQYAEQLDNVYCATCHAKIPAGHFTVNAWGPVAKSMGDRTDISAQNLELLTKFFQYHAKDVVGH